MTSDGCAANYERRNNSRPARRGTWTTWEVTPEGLDALKQARGREGET